MLLRDVTLCSPSTLEVTTHVHSNRPVQRTPSAYARRCTTWAQKNMRLAWRASSSVAVPRVMSATGHRHQSRGNGRGCSGASSNAPEARVIKVLCVPDSWERFVGSRQERQPAPRAPNTHPASSWRQMRTTEQRVFLLVMITKTVFMDDLGSRGFPGVILKWASPDHPSIIFPQKPIQLCSVSGTFNRNREDLFLRWC